MTLEIVDNADDWFKPQSTSEAPPEQAENKTPEVQGTARDGSELSPESDVPPLRACRWCLRLDRRYSTRPSARGRIPLSRSLAEKPGPHLISTGDCFPRLRTP